MKLVCASLFVSLLLVSLGTSIHIVSADSDHISFSSGVTIYSPVNRTYNSRFLTLNFTFACGWGIRYSLNYGIDGKYGGPMPYVINNPTELHVVYGAAGLVQLPELSEGLHSLTVSLDAPGLIAHKSSYSDTIYFAIDLTPPNISILSPVNKTYTAANITTAKIPLDFTVSENVSQVACSLDGHDKTTIAGNTTLEGLSTGSHTVTVYAGDFAGNTGATETTYFTIAEELRKEPEPETEQKSSTLFIAGIIGIPAVLAVSIGFILYNKKKRNLTV